jgi:phage-related protein
VSQFPPPLLAGKEDSAECQVEVEDVAVRSETDGGYVYTRARHTRTPRKTWTTGFTNISHAQKTELEQFYQTQRGGSDSFTYTPPTEGVEKIVRFKGPLKFQYTGAGTYFRWDVKNIDLEEV